MAEANDRIEKREGMGKERKKIRLRKWCKLIKLSLSPGDELGFEAHHDSLNGVTSVSSKSKGTLSIVA